MQQETGPLSDEAPKPRNPNPRNPNPRKLSPASLGWLITTALFGLLALLSLFAGPDTEGTSARGLPAFDLQGHRGARGLAPENSLPAFEKALAVGVTTLEMDGVMTADGTVVVYHDLRLHPERTRRSDGRWLSEEEPRPALFALESVALAGFDIGRLKPESETAQRFPEQQGADAVRIPTLAAVFARAEALSAGTIRYNIETKISPEKPELSPTPKRFAEVLVAAIRDAGVVGRTSVQSFDWRTLQAVQALEPTIPTVYLTAEQRWLDNLQRGRDGTSPWTAGLDVDIYDGSVPRLIQAAGGVVWSPYYRDLRPAELLEARRLGLRVVVWTVNEPSDMASLIDLGVDGIITDYPDRLRSVMEDKGMALPPAFGG